MGEEKTEKTTAAVQMTAHKIARGAGRPVPVWLTYGSSAPFRMSTSLGSERLWQPAPAGPEWLCRERASHHVVSSVGGMRTNSYDTATRSRFPGSSAIAALVLASSLHGKSLMAVLLVLRLTGMRFCNEGPKHRVGGLCHRFRQMGTTHPLVLPSRLRFSGHGVEESGFDVELLPSP